MLDMSVLAGLFGLAAVGILVFCITGIITLLEVRRTFRRLRGLLPRCDEAIHQGARVLHDLREILQYAKGAAASIDELTHRACAAAAETLGHMTMATSRMKAFFGQRPGSGAGAGPRRAPRRHR